MRHFRARSAAQQSPTYPSDTCTALPGTPTRSSGLPSPDGSRISSTRLMGSASTSTSCAPVAAGAPCLLVVWNSLSATRPKMVSKCGVSATSPSPSPSALMTMYRRWLALAATRSTCSAWAGRAPTTIFPGVAYETEWNNKDPFFDRDLNNFAALHREGAIAVGIIVTRGPRLQDLITPVIRSKDGGFKYGQSTTHWAKLLPKVNLGGGGECPLFLVGIEPERVDGIDVVAEVREELAAAAAELTGWRGDFDSYRKAQAHAAARRAAALDRLPPVGN